MKKILETERLYLREMTDEDTPLLASILKDEETMYAYGGAFSDEEVLSWLDNQKKRYRDYSLGLWLVFEKKGNSFVGQCGLTYQEWKGEKLLEIGYLLKRGSSRKFMGEEIRNM